MLRRNPKNRKADQGSQLTRIIQCPSCQAKFGINPDLFMHLETPRFHCSRCDHVFEMQSPTAEPEPHEPRQAREAVNSGEPVDNQPEPLIGSTSALLSLSEKESQFKEPKETPREKHAASSDSVEQSHKESQMEFPFAADSTTVTSTEIPRPTEHLYRDKDAELEETVDLSEGTEENHLDAERIRAAIPPQIKSGWNGAAVLGVPLVSLLVLLALLAVMLRSNPAMANAFTRRVFPAMPEPAPAGMHIKDLSLKNINLKDGSNLPVVSGTLVNGSKNSVSSIKLEAILYDSNGDRLSSTIFRLEQSLPKKQLAEGSARIIKKLQTTVRQKKLVLSRGEKKDFRFALTSKDLKDAAYYSLRVYSVIKDKS
ncbi:MAG: DUF3426 domain-containing protein [Candidatus Dadabacteria bacterium]|nr:MAG: DUF3426 domain-containing protein [Candidatus Dadabacteria bacterium]